MGVRPSTDEMNDITVLRELEKMKKWIIDYTWGRTIDHMDFKYGTGEESNKVTLTVTLLDGSTETADFRIKTITAIKTKIEGDLTYIVVALSDGSIFEVPLDLSTMVNIVEDQTIDGNKDFIGGVEVPDIVHEEGEEVQETNKAVNERFFKIHATERIDEKQDVLRSGENIKTVNGQSILGEGNIPIATVGTWGNIGGLISDQTDLVEFVAAKMQSVYPVGSIYMNANDNTNPMDMLGFGTWVSFGNGKVLVGVDPDDADFSESGLTGGEKIHRLTVDELPSHTHGMEGGGGHNHDVEGIRTVTSQGFVTSGTDVKVNGQIKTSTVEDHTHTINAAGGGNSHNNLQPFITVYMWVRTA